MIQYYLRGTDMLEISCTSEESYSHFFIDTLNWHISYCTLHILFFLASWSDNNKETNKSEITARFLFHFCKASVHEMFVGKVLPLVPVSMFQCSISHLAYYSLC